ncbi:hypothetical protein B0H10DRAFT_2437229 [Mycena sp. CBHHK59/15]|nr:hypothetical protein B0H10DRAFT_2437229 [Mycena sp. CBHHK59/15]
MNLLPLVFSSRTTAPRLACAINKNRHSGRLSRSFNLCHRREEPSFLELFRVIPYIHKACPTPGISEARDSRRISFLKFTLSRIILTWCLYFFSAHRALAGTKTKTSGIPTLAHWSTGPCALRRCGPSNRALLAAHPPEPQRLPLLRIETRHRPPELVLLHSRQDDALAPRFATAGCPAIMASPAPTLVPASSVVPRVRTSLRSFIFLSRAQLILNGAAGSQPQSIAWELRTDVFSRPRRHERRTSAHTAGAEFSTLYPNARRHIKWCPPTMHAHEFKSSPLLSSHRYILTTRSGKYSPPTPHPSSGSILCPRSVCAHAAAAQYIRVFALQTTPGAVAPQLGAKGRTCVLGSQMFSVAGDTLRWGVPRKAEYP